MHRAVLALALSTSAALAVPAVASAASVVDIYSAPIASESESLGSYQVSGDALGYASLDVDVKSKATWTGSLATHVGFDQAKVRQGGSLLVTRMSPFQNGKLKVSWTVGGTVKLSGFGTSEFATKTITTDAACMPLLLGGGYTCTAAAPGIPLIKTPGLPASPYVKLTLQARFKITPEGAIVARSLAGGPATNLTLTPAINTETVKLPCGPVGGNVTYRFGSFKHTPAVTVTHQPLVQVGLMDPILGLAESAVLYDQAFGPAVQKTPTFELTGAGHTTDLGPLQPDPAAC